MGGRPGGRSRGGEFGVHGHAALILSRRGCTAEHLSVVRVELGDALGEPLGAAAAVEQQQLAPARGQGDQRLAPVGRVGGADDETALLQRVDDPGHRGGGDALGRRERADRLVVGSRQGAHRGQLARGELEPVGPHLPEPAARRMTAGRSPSARPATLRRSLRVLRGGCRRAHAPTYSLAMLNTMAKTTSQPHDPARAGARLALMNTAVSPARNAPGARPSVR